MVYVAITVTYMSIYAAIYPRNYYLSWDWWCSLSGLAWMMILCYSRLLHDESLTWGIVTAGTAFVYVMCFVLLDVGDIFVMWLALNLLCFAPVIGIGAAANSVYLLTLGTLGFLMDAARFAMFVGDNAPDNFYVPMVSVVFAIAGIAIGILGIQFRKMQPYIHGRAQAWIQRSNEIVLEGGEGTAAEEPLLPQEDEHDEDQEETTPLA